jgi:hypothetical protein
MYRFNQILLLLLLSGVVCAEGRFVDNQDGTITDRQTALVWMKNADCWSKMEWDDAMEQVKNLNSGSFFSQTSCKGYSGQDADWRLPTAVEWESLIDKRNQPTLPNGHLFSGVRAGYYWTSSEPPEHKKYAWRISLKDGEFMRGMKRYRKLVWPIRGG